MIAIQLVSAHIGRVTGKGIAANAKQFYPLSFVLVRVFLLAVANTINIAADLAAMGEALYLVIGGLKHEHALIFAAMSVLLQLFVPYRRYVPILKFLTLVLFLYVAVAFTIGIPWRDVLVGTVLPTFSLNYDYLLLVVAVLGTTISPYLFFWQASEECEEVECHPASKPLSQVPRQAAKELHRIRVDTVVGMGVSNVIAFFIMLTAAVTLHAHGQTDIATAEQAAKALEPIAGKFAFVVFALGIIGTGLLAIPVLAGASAYAVGEAMNWPVGLERQPGAAKKFYSVIAISTMAGIGINFVRLDPVHALFWSAVVNGVVAVPLMVVMLLMATNPKVMGKFVITRGLKIGGWVATLVMAAASAGMFVTMGKS